MLYLERIIIVGLQHTAFAIRKEAHLERSSMFHSHIPRGELVGLLYKALAYIEVECHFRSQDEATKRCVAPFSLLEPHLCSSVHKSPSSTIVQPLPAIAPTPSSRHPDPSRDTSATASGEDAGIDRKTSKSQDHGTKRKAENVLTEVVSEKRVRIEPQAASQREILTTYRSYTRPLRNNLVMQLPFSKITPRWPRSQTPHLPSTISLVIQQR